MAALGVADMKMPKTNWLTALTVAAALTFILFGAAYAISDSSEHLARVLYWQGYSLQSLVSAANIGSAEHPIYEANPIHVVAYFAGLPVGMALYFLFVWVALHIFTAHRIAQQAIAADRADRPRSG